MISVLLDTTITAGVLANLLDSSIDKEDKRKEWVSATKNLLDAAGSEVQVSIPTPVFYELAAKNPRWYSIIESWQKPQSSRLFFYINHSLTPEVLKCASLYRLMCCGKKNDDNKEAKKMWPDSLIAALSLLYGHFLITSNIGDFDRRFFEVITFAEAPNKQTMYLLSPKQNLWEMMKSLTNGMR